MSAITTLDQLLARLREGSPEGPRQFVAIPGHYELGAVLARKYPRAFAVYKIVYKGPLLTVITFNLGYMVQINQTGGEDEAVVKACRSQPEGNAIKNSGFSVCSERALNWIKKQNATIVAVQNLNATKVTNFTKFFEDDMSSVVYDSLAMLYRNKVLGTADVISRENITSPTRLLYFIAWFPWVSVLAIVIHADYVSNLREIIEKKVKVALGVFKPAQPVGRILCLGDFGDIEGKLKELTILERTLRLRNDTTTSCCYRNGEYSKKGDYIFDSESNDAVYYSGNASPGNEFPLMSDHLPVTLRDIYYLRDI